MISVRVTGPAFCIPGLNEAMVTFARWKIFVLIPVNALHDREGVHHRGGAGSAKFISLEHKYHILLTNYFHGEFL